MIWNEELEARDPNFGIYKPTFVQRVLQAIFSPRRIRVAVQNFAVNGVDVSKWNGNMDFTITESRGTTFVYVRAGFGNGTVDEQLEANRTKISGLTHMNYGLYWFCYIGTSDPNVAAISFYNSWKDGPGLLPPVADLESTTLGALDTTAWVWQFQQTFEELAGVELMYYTSPGWANSNLAINNRYPLWNRRLWVANWTNGSSPIVPNLWSSHGKTWSFWQWSANGNGLSVYYGAPPPPAASADMDLDRYWGSLSDYQIEFPQEEPGPNPEPPPTEEDGEMIYSQYTETVEATLVGGKFNSITIKPPVPLGGFVDIQGAHIQIESPSVPGFRLNVVVNVNLRDERDKILHYLSNIILVSSGVVPYDIKLRIVAPISLRFGFGKIVPEGAIVRVTLFGYSARPKL